MAQKNLYNFVHHWHLSNGCRKLTSCSLSSFFLTFLCLRLQLGLFTGLVTRVDDENNGGHRTGEDLKGPEPEDECYA